MLLALATLLATVERRCAWAAMPEPATFITPKSDMVYAPPDDCAAAPLIAVINILMLCEVKVAAAW